jgi:hypothetical protein
MVRRSVEQAEATGVRQMADDDEKPWDKTPFAGWQTTVNGWKWQSLGGDDWEKSGSCPRCEHGMSVLKQGSYSLLTSTEDDPLAALIEAEGGPLLVDSGKFFARCDCGEEHPGRPASISRGCGQWADIDPPPDS